ncbi:EF-hand_domain [Hexamita inflata]|uniref:EF-hand domain n=1 Tax=Hexamita inflata TaxID=28002 RepID=A0AA86RJ18_9EUKA|nr:EF-hand domain [Hexamita inflata]CAI9973054.1 EF-hand domain [Hexamita inflata]
MKYSKDVFEQLFYEADKNQNNGIEYTELYKFLKRYNMNPDLDYVRKLFQKFDKNDSGKIEIQEWCEMMPQIFQ